MKQATINILNDNGTTQRIETTVKSINDLHDLAQVIAGVYGNNSAAGFFQFLNHSNDTTTFIDLRKTVSIAIKYDGMFTEE